MAMPVAGWQPDFEDHALGVHINLRHESYLRDAGLGYGAIKDNLASPIEWWDASAWNPNRPPEPNKRAFEVGEAAHVHFLMGPKAYNAAYGIWPTKETHPDYAESVLELQERCAAAKIDEGGTRAEMARRLAKAGAGDKVMILEREAFIASGKKPIDYATDMRIRILHRMAMRSAQELHLADGECLTLEDALKGGLAELSVFWIDEAGVRQRARFDYIKPNVTIDLKTITEWRATDFRTSLLAEAIMRGYVIQAVHYDVAREELRKAVAEGRVFGGNKTQRKLLERIAAADAWGWTWIFAKMDGAPQVKGIVLPKNSGQYEKAVRQRTEALMNFVYYRDFFGMTTPWFDTEVVWEPAEDDWPPFSVIQGG